MPDIILSLKNISRFSKRLKTALEQQFNQKVPLHVASKLLASATGSSTLYELQQHLSKQVAHSHAQSIENKAQTILKIIKQHVESTDSYIRIFNCSQENGIPLACFEIAFERNNETQKYYYNLLCKAGSSKNELISTVKAICKFTACDLIFLSNLFDLLYDENTDRLELFSCIKKLLGLNEHTEYQFIASTR